MNILGIHDGHNCGATLTRDGHIVASICEERLTRQKNEVGYPRRSIEAVLRLGGIDSAELSKVVYASLFMHAADHLRDPTLWYDRNLADQHIAQQKPDDYKKLIFNQRRQERLDDVCNHLGLPGKKIEFLEHHLAHLTAAYYTAPNVQPGQPILGLTCDGSGDNISATASICRDGKIERLAQTSRHASLGKIYSRATMLMGMKPWEHEYKLMGIAPYADPERSDRAAQPLRKLLKLSEDGLRFEQVGELSTNFCFDYLRKAFDCVRFDTVAGAVQLFTEEMLLSWAEAAVGATGIPDIVCGGGVFMNVKANMMIGQSDLVRSLYVMPSASDESLSFGAALHHYYQCTGKTDYSDSMLRHLYLGNGYDKAAAETTVRTLLNGAPVRVEEPDDIDGYIAEKLAAGSVVARSRGRAEWGARALGNRSILANAEDYRTVDRINRMIKQRDFWMPFAPSIRDESSDRYFDDPKDLKPWFMTLAYPARSDTRLELTAASHPRDFTIRPQTVTADANPGYHRVISRFEELTGRGVVLNTSFNLHGYPIVDAPEDAIDVLMRSDLDTLALDGLVITKTENTHGAS